MKKWKIIVLISILAVTILGVSGVLIYNFYLVPNYIEPVVQEISEYVNQDEMMNKLYREAVRLHDEGIIDDDIYAEFVRAYNKSKRSTLEYAQNVLDQYSAEDTLNSGKNNTRSTNYASYKVGVETVLVNDEGESGKSDVRYSDERSSDRIKAETIVEAEKIIEEAELDENKSEAGTKPDTKPYTKSDTKPDTKADTKPETKSDAESLSLIHI